MKKTIIFPVLICLLLIGCQSAGTSIPNTGDFQFGMVWFDRAMIRLMEKWEMPGGVLAVMQDGEIVLARGYGYADVESRELVQPDSLFRIASISKPITAVAVLKLVEDGELSLDTPPFQLLDELQPLEGAQIDSRINQITIRHLLSHTGGWDRNASFDPMFMSGEISQAMGVPAPADCPTIIRYMLGQPLDFDPGTQYAYSNYGYCVLGRVIEKVTGMGYEDYVKTHILAPVGIDDMYIGHILLEDRYPREVRYYGTEETLTPSVFPEIAEFTTWPYGGFYLEAMDSHGGWIASAPDLVHFASALEDTGSAGLLGPETMMLMVSRPAIPLWEGTENYYALGWFVRPSGTGVTLWHGGSLPGTTTVLYRSANGLTWAALFNTRADPPDDTFLIELITAMGLASVMNYMVLGAVIMVVLIGAGVFFFLRWRRRRRDQKEFFDG